MSVHSLTGGHVIRGHVIRVHISFLSHTGMLITLYLDAIISRTISLNMMVWVLLELPISSFSYNNMYPCLGQSCANIKFLPLSDIRYFYNLKSDTQYPIPKTDTNIQHAIHWNYLWSKEEKVKTQRCNSFIFFNYYFNMVHTHININCSLYMGQINQHECQQASQ